jgi:heme-degrading monooxygenase HmoA
MFTRIVTLTGAKDIEAGITFVRDTVSPVLHQQKGFRGTTASVDRANNVFSVLTLWDSAADRDASESALLKVRDEGQKVIGGKLTVELFEEVLVELVGKPTVGAQLLLRRVTMDPARIDENVTYFRDEVLPEIKANPGLLAVRNMVNRETGEAMTGTLWKDKAALEAAAADAEKRIEQVKAEGRVVFGEQSRRELVFVDLV